MPAVATKPAVTEVKATDPADSIRLDFAKRFPTATKINVIAVTKSNYRVNVYEDVIGGEVSVIKSKKMVHSEYVRT